MIVSKSQSQVTVPEESRGQFTSCKIGDSVLYHSQIWTPGKESPVIENALSAFSSAAGIVYDDLETC